MDRFLRGLLHDLVRRCALLCDRLATAHIHPDAQGHSLAAYQDLEQLRRDAAQLLSDPDLGISALLPNHLRRLQRWQRGAGLIESSLLPFVERYTDADRRLTWLCRRLTQQVGWPLAAPLVCGFSSNYYWTFPHVGLICVPTGEGLTLLGLPDLSHELGHMLHVRHEARLIGDFTRELLDYIDQEKRRVTHGQRPKEYGALYDPLLAVWRDKWLPEFVADMVATYLLGPAYGWQHVRLCATTGQPAFRPALGDVADHPANEARLYGVLAVLSQAGAGPASADAQTLWNAYLNTTGESKPADYDVCYPPTLIETLARRVADGCAALGIRRFDAAVNAGGAAGGTGGIDIPSLLGEAWTRFLADPQAYAQWEPAQLDALWRDLGLLTP